MGLKYSVKMGTGVVEDYDAPCFGRLKNVCVKPLLDSTCVLVPALQWDWARQLAYPSDPTSNRVLVYLKDKGWPIEWGEVHGEEAYSVSSHMGTGRFLATLQLGRFALWEEDAWRRQLFVQLCDDGVHKDVAFMVSQLYQLRCRAVEGDDAYVGSAGVDTESSPVTELMTFGDITRYIKRLPPDNETPVAEVGHYGRSNNCQYLCELGYYGDDDDWEDPDNRPDVPFDVEWDDYAYMWVTTSNAGEVAGFLVGNRSYPMFLDRVRELEKKVVPS